MRFILGCLVLLLALNIGVAFADQNPPQMCNDNNYSATALYFGFGTTTRWVGETFRMEKDVVITQIEANVSVSGVTGDGLLQIAVVPLIEGVPQINTPLAVVSKSAVGMSINPSLPPFYCATPTTPQTFTPSVPFQLNAHTSYAIIMREIPSCGGCTLINKGFQWWRDNTGTKTFPYAAPIISNEAGTTWVVEPSLSDYLFGLNGHEGVIPPHWLTQWRNRLGFSDNLGSAIFIGLLSVGFVVLLVKVHSPGVVIAGLLMLLTLALMRIGLISPAIVLGILAVMGVIVFLLAVSGGGKQSE